MKQLIIQAEVSQPSCQKAELTSLLTQQREIPLALDSSFPRSFVNLCLRPHPPSSVMNGRHEFSMASPGFSLRPSAAEQTTSSQLKGAIRNLLKPCSVRVNLCMDLEAFEKKHVKWVLVEGS